MYSWRINFWIFIFGKWVFLRTDRSWIIRTKWYFNLSASLISYSVGLSLLETRKSLDIGSKKYFSKSATKSIKLIIKVCDTNPTFDKSWVSSSKVVLYQLSSSITWFNHSIVLFFPVLSFTTNFLYKHESRNVRKGEICSMIHWVRKKTTKHITQLAYRVKMIYVMFSNK